MTPWSKFLSCNVKIRKGHITEHPAISCPKPPDFTGNGDKEYRSGEVIGGSRQNITWVLGVSPCPP